MDDREYQEFLNRKAQHNAGCGFNPVWLPDFLFDFQRVLVEWATRRGRAAIFANCGLGKSPMSLVWAENVIRHTNRPVLIATTLAVGRQFVQEGEKFGVEVVRSPDGSFPAGARVVVTNYERLHHFRPDDFAGVVCDESSCIKDAKTKTKAAVAEFLRTRPYRLLCTATAAPNDYIELGTSSEVLGELGYQDMITKFFKQKYRADFRGWSRLKYDLRGHAERDFWRWVCSWARAVRKPSDLGFDDGPFRLPPLEMREHVVEARTHRDGYLFDLPAASLPEQREEQRRTIAERCERVASLVADTGRPAVTWCYLNDEADMLERLIPGAVQVAGSDPEGKKEERLEAFAAGQVRVLVTKPTIAGYGLNWQHCAHQTFFPSNSFEQWYQAIGRCLRYGQAHPVGVDIVTTAGGEKVLATLQRKAAAAEAMFGRLVELMNDSLRVGRGTYGDNQQEIPSWL